MRTEGGTSHRRRRPGPHRGPVDLEQRAAGVAACRLDLRLLDRPDVEPLHTGDRTAVLTGDVDPQRGVARRPAPHPQPCEAAAVQTHPGPGERQPAPGAAALAEHAESAVQCGVEQRGVDGEPLGRSRVVRQREFGADLVAGAPCRLDAPEGGAVVEVVVGQVCVGVHTGVERVDGDRFGTGRRPLRRERLGRLRVHGQPATPVARRLRPLVVGSGLRLREDRDLAPAVLAGLADGDLDVPYGVLLQDQR